MSSRRLARLVILLALAACARPSVGVRPADAWVATWTAPQQLVEPRNLPPAPGLAGNTLRQSLRVSLGGTRIRVTFSNEYGTTPLVLTAARIATPSGRGGIITGSDAALSFNDRGGVTIAPGTTVTSDVLERNVRPLSDLAVSVHVATMPVEVTGHPGSRTTSYIATGQQVDAKELIDAVTVERWFVIAAVHVEAADTRGVVVTIGNSITDGRGSGTDRNNRWPDVLAARLAADATTAGVGVVNAGIGGNAVLAGGLGPQMLSRFERDVLAVSGARWVIVLAGINDIGTSPPAEADAVAQRLIAAYERMIALAKRRGLRAYGCTLGPFGGSFYDAPERERARQTVNAWIRSGSAFDAIIDFDAALRDPANPTRLLPGVDTGDHLHPNEAGYRIMGEAIDLRLFIR